MSEGKVFLDANILVYAHDVSAGKKHDVARAIVAELWIAESGVLSAQVLQEWFVTVTRKIRKPLEAPAARRVVEDLLSWEVIANDGASVLAAIDLQQRMVCSFWDGLILQAALRAGASRLLSEDFTHGQKVDRLRIENPFLESAQRQ